MAQAPVLSVDFIPYPVVKLGQFEYFQEVCLTNTHALFERRHPEKGGRELFAVDRSNLGVVAHPFSAEVPGGGSRQRWITVNKKVYTIVAHHDFNSGLLRVLVEPRSDDGGESAGDPREVGRLQIEKKTYLDEGKLGLVIELSPNEERCAIFFDRLRSAEREQLIMCWVLDGAMQPVWSNGYRVGFESDGIATTDVKVTDQGAVYALMLSRFKNKPIANKHINYSYKAFLMNKEEFRENAVDLPRDLSALSCRMILRTGGIRCAGFYVQPEQTVEETAGAFVADMDAQVIPIGEAMIQRYPQPIDEQITVAELRVRADGGSFLIGGPIGPWGLGSKKAEGSKVMVHALDEQGNAEWDSRIAYPIKAGNYGGLGFRAIESNDRLLLCFNDDAKNLELYKSGSGPDHIPGKKNIVITVAFDVNGTPSYSELGGGHYSLNPSVFDLENDHSAWLGAASDIQGKKKREGFALVRIE